MIEACCRAQMQILPQRIRYGLTPGYMERRRREAEEALKVPVLVPEQYRMFAEHRVVIEVDNSPLHRRQGRTAVGFQLHAVRVRCA